MTTNIKRWVLGFCSTLFLAVGLVRAADSLDPMSRDLRAANDATISSSPDTVQGCNFADISSSPDTVQGCNFAEE